MAGTVAASAVSASSYRAKFRRAEFLKLVEIAKPSIIYHRGRLISSPMMALLCIPTSVRMKFFTESVERYRV